MTDPSPVRVLVCDDSVTARMAITRMLRADPDIAVVAQATNGQDAVRKVEEIPTDVVLLDIEMPIMDGIAALPLLRRARPGVQVIMASATTSRGAAVALGALRMGAADYLAKPDSAAFQTGQFQQEMIATVKGVARRARIASPTPAARPSCRPAGRRPRLLAVGCSTGGPQALLAFFRDLGRCPLPVIVTQHMPSSFIPELAAQIARLGIMPCAEARHGAVLLPGHVYLAPGGCHLLVEAAEDDLVAVLSTTPPENFCRPAVDPMLRSAANATDGRVLVIMLTGMGQDGLLGTRHAVAKGATAMAQDEASSVVWGMPGAIAQAGLCHAVLPLSELGAKAATLIGAGVA